MRGRATRWTTVAVSAAWLASAGFAATVLTVLPSIAVPPLQVALVLVIALIPLGLGIVVAVRAPGNAAAALLGAAGFCLVATNLVAVLPGWLEGTWMLLYLPLAVLLLVVPDGHAASRRWAAVGWTITAVVAAFIGVVALQAIVPRVTDTMMPIAYVLLFVFFALLVVCAAAPVARYRRASEYERMQLRWVFLAGASLPLTLLLCWASYLVLGEPDLVAFGLILTYVAIPVGVTVALVRPQLVDIDRAAVVAVTSTMLAMGVLGALSVASAAAGVAMINWSPTAAVTSTVVLTVAAVALYAPLRRAFDRLLYPERGRAIAAIRALSARVDAGTGEPEEVEGVLRVSLRDPGLAIAYRRVADGVLRDRDGRQVPLGAAATPVRLHGEEIGALISSAARVKRPASAVASAAAPPVEAVRVRTELARARAEVEASRERMLRAGYEERRRLERDLHDGAQQRLVALGMQLRVLQRTQRADAETSVALDAVVAELGTAVAELRRIAQGVRPSALDDGLGAALTDLTRTTDGMVEVDVQTPDLPDAVATTAYYVVSEAVANALRHSGASRIRVTARECEGTLSVRIDDDGTGGAAMTPTGGLTGLVDRVEAIGGRLSVDSRSGSGTTVEARLPCGS